MTNEIKNYGIVILGDHVLLSKNDDGEWEFPAIESLEDEFNRHDLISKIQDDAGIAITIEQDIGTEDEAVYWFCKPEDEEISPPETTHNDTSKWVNVTFVAEELDENIPEFLADFFETRELRKATIW